MLKTFEISKKNAKSGRRKFKLILHEVYPDSAIDTSKQVGVKYNLNGITWIREHCEKAIEKFEGMSLRAEFLDEERTQLCGHGETDVVDGEPIFEDAVVIGSFDKIYIDDVTDEDGNTITACIGEGTIDSSCYHNFCVKLDEDIANGIYPSGSVEIMHSPDNEGIGYLYGYVDKGRIPSDFVYSGYALLGVAPADKKAKLLELNERKEEKCEMTENEINSIVEKTVAAMTNHEAELNQCKANYDAQIAELNSQIATITAEKNEIEANSQKIQEALDANTAEMDETRKQMAALWEERNALEKALGEAKAKERVGELNAALVDYTEEEQSYAQAEIAAFNEDPINSEINSVVNAILVGIGKKAKESAVVSEQNAANIDDIFAPMIENNAPDEVSIF